MPVEPVAHRHRVGPHLRQQRHHLLPRPRHAARGQQPQLQQVRRGVLPELDEREERVEPAEQGQEARVVLGRVEPAGVRAGLEALEALVEVREAGGEGVGAVCVKKGAWFEKGVGSWLIKCRFGPRQGTRAYSPRHAHHVDEAEAPSLLLCLALPLRQPLELQGEPLHQREGAGLEEAEEGDGAAGARERGGCGVGLLQSLLGCAMCMHAHGVYRGTVMGGASTLHESPIPYAPSTKYLTSPSSPSASAAGPCVARRRYALRR